MGASESRGCVSLGAGGPGGPAAASLRPALYEGTRLPRNEDPLPGPSGVVPQPGELEYSWAAHRGSSSRGGGVATLVSIPRPGGAAPLEVEAAVLTDGDLRGPDKVALAACYPSAWARAQSDTSAAVFAERLGVERDEGLPRHSRSYRFKGLSRGAPAPALTRLDLKGSDRFQSFWLLEVPAGMEQDRLTQVYSLLKRHTADLAFFKGSELVLPLVGFSSHAAVSADEVAEAALSWAYHCARRGPHLRRITFVLPAEAHLAEVERLFERYGRITRELGERVPDGDGSELYRRRHVSALEDALWAFSDRAREFVAEHEGKPAGAETRRRAATVKVMLHHVGLVLDALENSSDEAQLVRVICAAGRATAEAFVDYDPSMSSLGEMDTAQEKIEYVLRTLELTGNRRGLTADDFAHVRLLLAVGTVAKSPALAPQLNALDAMFALQATVHLVHVFFDGKAPEATSRLAGADDRALDDIAAGVAAAGAAAAGAAAAALGGGGGDGKARGGGGQDSDSAASEVDLAHADEARRDDGDDDGGRGESLASLIDLERFHETGRLTEDEVNELAAKMRESGSGLALDTRKVRLKKYRDAFVGSEAVDWLRDRLRLVHREEAVDVAGAVLRAGLVATVADSAPAGEFTDSNAAFYTFASDDEPVAIDLSRGEMRQIVEQMRDADAGVPLKDRKQRFKSFKATFTGAGATEWLAGVMSLTPGEAVGVGQQLLAAGYVRHITQTHEFKNDAKTYYQFTGQEEGEEPEADEEEDEDEKDADETDAPSDAGDAGSITSRSAGSDAGSRTSRSGSRSPSRTSRSRSDSGSRSPSRTSRSGSRSPSRTSRSRSRSGSDSDDE